MTVTATYGDLTDQEQAFWNEYETLREISDWVGFDAAQQQRKEAARKWLVNRRKEIWRLAQPKPKGDGGGWRRYNRRQRYNMLRDDSLNAGAPKHEVRLPAPACCTNTEKVYIEEREGYLAFATVSQEQKVRKLANLNWLIARRKRLYHLTQEDKTDERQRRYEALCIATRHGSYYKKWDAAHNKWGVPYGDDPKNFRDEIVSWCKHNVGIREKPPGSNSGEPQPSGWMRRVYGGTHIPWCACFSVCSAWDAGVKGSGTASVQLNVNMARRGQGIFRGYTTDPSRVRRGDHCAVISTSTHTEVIVGPSAWDTVGGNTGPSSISNGGMVAASNRRGRIVGWLLLREP